MLCDICKKNEAIIRIQKIENGKAVAVNLCAECADKHKAHEHFEFGDIDIGEILSNIKKITKNMNLQDLVLHAEAGDKNFEKNVDDSLAVKCPKCGLTLAGIDKNSGRMGCDECYRTFADEVLQSIENIHRCKIHVGKHPIGARKVSADLLAEKIRKLEDDLQIAIQSEKYEEAALLRDEINLLKKSEANIKDE